MYNLVQAEFFHVNVSGAPSLEALLAECRERLKDGLELTLHGKQHGSGIKTVIRFYDENGTVTASTQLAKKADEERQDIGNDFLHAGWFERKMLNRTRRKIIAQAIALKKDCKVTTCKCLRDAIKASKEIAIEKSDHRFRMARKDELHELYESVAKANGMWLFIFEPNGLLSDQNKLVTNLW